MSDSQRLKEQMQFLLEIDKSKNIYRQSYVTDASRHENDAEHAWHLALMAMILNEYSNEEVNLLRVIQMVLIHDLVEIDAGDTYAYDESGNETKRDREVKAAKRIFNILPKDQADFVRNLWEEFEEAETKEALFALSLDKIHPILINDATEGRAWEEHGVKKEQILNRNKETYKGSEALWKYARNLVDKNAEKGKIKK